MNSEHNKTIIFSRNKLFVLLREMFQCSNQHLMAFLDLKLLFVIFVIRVLELLLKQCSSFVCENPRNGAFKKAFCLIFSNLKLKPLIVFAKSSVLDVLPGSECTPKVNIKNLSTIYLNKLVKISQYFGAVWLREDEAKFNAALFSNSSL